MRRFSRIAVVLVIVMAVFLAAEVPVRRTAKAEDGPSSWALQEVIKQVLRRMAGDNNMTDAELKAWVENKVQVTFNAMDYQISPARIDENVSYHCWHVYSRLLGLDESPFYVGRGLVPGEYTQGDEFAQLNVCTRAGYIPPVGGSNDIYPI